MLSLDNQDLMPFNIL